MAALRLNSELLSRPNIREVASYVLTPHQSYHHQHYRHMATRCLQRPSPRYSTPPFLVSTVVRKDTQRLSTASRTLQEMEGRAGYRRDGRPLGRVTANRARGATTTTTTTTTTGAAADTTKVRSQDRGPASTEDTMTDFGSLDVLGSLPLPSTSIDSCTWDGFHLNSGVKVTGGVGVLLIGGEAFAWQPWLAGHRELRLVNEMGQWEVDDSVWGVLDLVWPKPDLLIIGLGKEMMPLSPKTKAYINSLGIRVDIQDTRNAAAQFNLLATERGVANVAGALIPLGWKEGKGIQR